jgi:hypothetical protein
MALRRWGVVAVAMAACLGGSLALAADNKPAPPDAHLYIIYPRNGQVIKGGAFWLRMGLKGMGIAPAGVEWPNTGHHHVIIDVDPPPLGEPIPNDRNHLHFGAGRTEARIQLPPGKHTLQLVLADENHLQFTPTVMSNRITVTVP